jgi:transcription elongation factor Elf1
MIPLYQHFKCPVCNHEVYILTDDRLAKAYCRKCSEPMIEQVIGKVHIRAVRGSYKKRKVGGN